MNLKSRRLFLTLCVALVLMFSHSWLCAQDSNTTVVKIDYARHTDYEKDPDTGNEIIVLTGNVAMTVTKGESVTEISATMVRYDRKTSMLFAQGDVFVKQSGGSGGRQEAKANTLLFNTDTLEGIFDNSRIVRYGQEDSSIPSGSTLVASSKLMGSNSSGTMAFRHATITFCDDENPHWKIRASKAWMLPGGEFAFVNALLYVGHIPLLYLPAFYYPKDELVFNPVVGYDSRRGYFVQTTTYLLGRKPLSAYDTETSKNDGSFSFGKPSTLKEQRREGIVLHNLDKDYKGATDNYLKLTADYYTNLGGMVGIDGSFTPKDSIFLKNVKGFFDLGYSNTVFFRNEVFSIYGKGEDGYYKYHDRSNFLGNDLPFRYAGNFEIEGTSPFNYSVSMPVYSDPYFLIDYGGRQEYMDWVNFLTSSGEKVTDVQKNIDDDERKVTSFNWDAKLSYSLPIPEVINPFLTTASVDFSSSVLFDSWKRTDKEFASMPSAWQTYSPERELFYPSLVTPVRLSAKVGGTFFSYSQIMPEDDGTATEERKAKKEEGKRNGVFSVEDLPELNSPSVPSLTKFEGFKYSLDWSVTPHYVTQNTYNTSTSFKENAEFDWDEKYSSYKEVETPIKLTSNSSYGGKFLSMTNSIQFDPYYQTHPELDGYTSESSKKSVRKADYEARKMDIEEANLVSFRPFVYDPIFRETGLDWSSTVKLLRTKFIGDADNPDWDYLTAEADDDKSITENLLKGYLAARESEKLSQKLTLSSSLPPREGEYDAALSLLFPHVEANFALGTERIESTDENEKESWKEKPFQQSLAVNLFKTFKFTESFNYNMQEQESDSLKYALSWSGFQTAYTKQRTYGYDYDKSKRVWTSEKEKKFQPYSLSFGYISPTKTFRYWRKRIAWAPSLETSLVWNLIKPTESYFIFIPAMTFRINQFMFLTFSSESRNSVVFRYVEDHTQYAGVLSGEKNVFVDLFNSFAFWDRSLRKASGFKVKNFKITLAHNLHDWTFASSFVFKPKLETDENNRSRYNYDPYFSFLITWRPMSGLRTQVIDNYGQMQLNP